MDLKKFLAGVLACCIAGGVLPSVENVTNKTVITASAVDEEEYTEGKDGVLSYRKYADHIEIAGCASAEGEIIIPETIEGLPVTEIGYNAFNWKKEITSVKFPESIESIGLYAFYGCTKLESFNIPKNLKTVEGWAFLETKWLEEQRKKSPFVSFNGILIDGSACEGEVTIPDDITEIAEGAFAGAENITSIKIPSSVKGIGNSTFVASSLVSIEIPDTVEHIGKGVFASCYMLESVVLPNIDIDFGAIYYSNSSYTFFQECVSLKSVVIPESVKSIGGGVFSHSSSLTTIELPKNLECIEAEAFHGCEKLESINIPGKIKSIDVATFWECSSLTSITVPENVESIGMGAFCDCAKLESIIIENPDCFIADMPETICNGGYESNEPYLNGTIYGYENSTAQEYAEKWGYKFETIRESAVKYGDANCDGQVTIADSTAILQALGNPDKYGLSAKGAANADCCDPGDGVLPSDALAIQKVDAKVITKLPEITK